MSIIQPKAMKSLFQFTTTLYAKPNTHSCSLCAAKSKRRSIIEGGQVWPNIPKSQGRTKINEHVKSEFYNWILHHHQNFQSPIANDCLRIIIDGEIIPQLVPTLLLQVSFRNLHYSMISPIEEGQLKETREKYGNITIIYTTLRNTLLPQFKKMSSR